MRAALVAFSSFAALIAAAGCASILAIPNDPSLEWCQQPTNKHDFCEDFDHVDPFAAWPASPMPPPGTTRGLSAGDSPPYALDTAVDALEAGASAFTGLETSFSEPFDDVKVGAEIRVAQIHFTTVAPITGAGFMLLSELNETANEPSLCIGLGLAPSMLPGTVDLALFLVPNSSDCVSVNNLDVDAAAPSPDESDAGPNDAGPSEAGPNDAAASALPAYPVTNIVGEIYLQTWTHLSLEVVRSGDGSGVITFAATPNTGAASAVPVIPPNSLSGGVPSLGIATDVTGPSTGPFEIQFDDITVDFGNAAAGD